MDDAKESKFGIYEISSRILNMLFAPMYLLMTYYFKFRFVAFVFVFISLIFLTLAYIKENDYKQMIAPFTYVVMCSLAYYLISPAIMFYIPMVLSFIFLFFAISSYNKKQAINLVFTKIPYKENEKYWIWMLSLNALIQILILEFTNYMIWSIYTSAGWYVLFLLMRSLHSKKPSTVVYD